MATPLLTGESRLRIFPTIVKPSAGQYLVIRRDTGTMVQTTESGVESIRLLQQGLTIDGTRAAIGGKYGCDPSDVDIMPLVECLLASDFVAQIDGRTIARSSPRLVRVLRGMWMAYVYAPLLSILIRRAPLSVTLRLLLRVRKASSPLLFRTVTENMRRVPAVARPGVDLGRLAAANCAALKGFYFERLLLAALPPARLDRWLRTRAGVEGAAHLDRAIAAGRGTILCAFHTASYSMVPFILAARGYAQTILMEASAESASQVRARLDEIQHAGYPYALEPVAVEHGLRGLVRALNRGGTVLLLFDPTIGEGDQHLKTPFLGGSLRVARGIAWLAARTAAPLLPLTLSSEPHGRYRVAIHPPLTAENSEGAEGVVAALAGVLEAEVLARPEAWLKWKDVHQMVQHA
jgi:lauroyl/myristoyl acyltransferase